MSSRWSKDLTEIEKEDYRNRYRESKNQWYLKHRQECINKAKLWKQLNPEALSKIRRKENLKNKYNFSQKEFVELYYVQEGKCAICEKELLFKGCGKERYKVANIDHCHKINQVRGLLCTSCNKGLGQFYDQPSLLVKASEYLRKFNQKCLN